MHTNSNNDHTVLVSSRFALVSREENCVKIYVGKWTKKKKKMGKRRMRMRRKKNRT